MHRAMIPGVRRRPVREASSSVFSCAVSLLAPVSPQTVAGVSVAAAVLAHGQRGSPDHNSRCPREAPGRGSRAAPQAESMQEYPRGRVGAHALQELQLTVGWYATASARGASASLFRRLFNIGNTASVTIADEARCASRISRWTRARQETLVSRAPVSSRPCTHRFNNWIDPSTFGIGLAENGLPTLQITRTISERHDIGSSSIHEDRSAAGGITGTEKRRVYRARKRFASKQMMLFDRGMQNGTR